MTLSAYPDTGMPPPSLASASGASASLSPHFRSLALSDGPLVPPQCLDSVSSASMATLLAGVLEASSPPLTATPRHGFPACAPFTAASLEEGNFLLVLVVRLSEIVCREWRLVSVSVPTSEAAATSGAAASPATPSSARRGSVSVAEQVTAKLTWLATQAEMLVRALCALVRVGQLVDSFSPSLQSAVSFLLPSFPHTIPFLLKRLLATWPSQSSTRQMTFLQVC